MIPLMHRIMSSQTTSGHHSTSIPILPDLGTMGMVPDTVARYGWLGKLLSERAVALHPEWEVGEIHFRVP